MFLSIGTGITIILFITFISISIGRYTQNKYNLLISNNYLSFALGFSIYMVIITLFFMPSIIFKFSGTILFYSWWLANTLFVIFIIIKYKIIKIHTIFKVQIFWFLIFSIIMLITIKFFIGFAKTNAYIFFTEWIKGNEYTKNINENIKNIKIDNNFLGQGWYYLQTVILRSTQMDQNFMNYWVFGTIVSLLMTSVSLGFVYSILKKSNIIIFSITCSASFLIMWLLIRNIGPNIGVTPFIWNFILLFILLINFISAPKISYMYLMSIIGFTGWTYDYLQIFFSIMFLFAVMMILIFKESYLLYEFLIIFSLSITLMIIIFLFPLTIIAFWIGLIIWAFLLLISIYILEYKVIALRKSSLYIYKFRYVISIIILSVLSCLAIVFWVINKTNKWFNFSYNGDGLMNDNPLENGFVIPIITYIIYWILVIWSIFIIVWYITKYMGNDKLLILQFFSAISLLLFFNPFVASFFNGHFLPKKNYNLVRILVFVPYILIIPIYIFKIKYSFIISSIIPFTTLSLIYGLFFNSSFNRSNLSLFNGVNVSTIDVAKWIKKNHFETKSIIGDTDGIFAYINSPNNYLTDSQNYNYLHNTILTNQIYKKVNDSKIQILIKNKERINNFDYAFFKFKRVDIGKFWVYYK